MPAENAKKAENHSKEGPINTTVGTSRLSTKTENLGGLFMQN